MLHYCGTVLIWALQVRVRSAPFEAPESQTAVDSLVPLRTYVPPKGAGAVGPYMRDAGILYVENYEMFSSKLVITPVKSINECIPS